MKPDTSHWRSDSAYDFMDHASVDDLAWECLRRNRDYQTDFRDLHRKNRLENPLPKKMERRWGLRFRSPTLPLCD